MAGSDQQHAEMPPGFPELWEGLTWAASPYRYRVLNSSLSSPLSTIQNAKRDKFKLGLWICLFFIENS